MKSLSTAVGATSAAVPVAAAVAAAERLQSDDHLDGHACASAAAAVAVAVDGLAQSADTHAAATAAAASLTATDAAAPKDPTSHWKLQAEWATPNCDDDGDAHICMHTHHTSSPAPSAADTGGRNADDQQRDARDDGDGRQGKNGAVQPTAAPTPVTTSAAVDDDDADGLDGHDDDAESIAGGPSLTAFLRLQQSDPAVCAALIRRLLRLAQRHAPHLLHALDVENEVKSKPEQQPPQSPTTTAAVIHGATITAAATLTADASPTQPQPPSPVKAESEEAKAIRISQLRDDALVAGTIAIALSFLPASERLALGLVSRVWRSGVQQPSLWANAEWRFGELSPKCISSAHVDHCHKCTPPPAPLWLRRRLGRVHCFPQQLLHLKLLAMLRSFTSVKHLDIGRGSCEHAPSASAEDIRHGLQPLRLLSLAVADLNSGTEVPLRDALLGPARARKGRAADTASGPASAPLLHLWAPTLTELKVDQTYLSRTPSAKSRLMEAVSRLHWPALRSLSLSFLKARRWPSASSVLALLPKVLMGERMPQLQTLRIGDNDRHGDVAFESALLAALPLISSSLTELDLKFRLGYSKAQSDDGLPGLHLLPSLRVLRCHFPWNGPMESAFARSIALAPKLEVLQLYFGGAASAICEQLRLRCEAASRDRSHGSSGGLGTGPVMLRELLVAENCRDIGDHEMAALALLPHLERLDFQANRVSVFGLSGLRRLRSLHLRFDDNWDDGEMVDQIRRLAHLKSLTLTEGEFYYESSTEPTVMGCLHRLLEMPSLTHLRLPWLSADQAHLLRLLHSASGPDRRDLVIDTEAEWKPPPAGLFGV